MTRSAASTLTRVAPPRKPRSKWRASSSGKPRSTSAPKQAASRGANAGSGDRGAAGDTERGREGAAGNDWTDARDGERADPNQNAERAAEEAAAKRAGGGPASG